MKYLSWWSVGKSSNPAPLPPQKSDDPPLITLVTWISKRWFWWSNLVPLVLFFLLSQNIKSSYGTVIDTKHTSLKVTPFKHQKLPNIWVTLRPFLCHRLSLSLLLHLLCPFVGPTQYFRLACVDLRWPKVVLLQTQTDNRVLPSLCTPQTSTRTRYATLLVSEMKWNEVKSNQIMLTIEFYLEKA